MSSTPSLFPCGHERRPGTTVCIHCRAEGYRVVRRRFLRVATLVVGGSLAGGSAVAGALWLVSSYGGGIAAYARSIAATPQQRVVTHVTQPVSVASVAMPTIASAAPVELHEASPPAAAEVVPDSAPAQPAALALVVEEGRTLLDSGIAVVRHGDTARVHFDTPVARTRLRRKFDAIVSRTLPLLYGARIDSLLPAAVADSARNAGDLVRELPARGLGYTLADGSTLQLWPETRPGRDGPLVVSYRATVTQGTRD